MAAAAEQEEERREPQQEEERGPSLGRFRPNLKGQEQKAEKEEEIADKSKPSNLEELYDIIAEGEKVLSEEQRRERARVYGGAVEAERRRRAYEALPARRRRALDSEVSRILKAADKSHYAVLGVRRSSKTSAVKQRYRAKALLVHPDANKSPKAPEAFDILRQAHETLADPLKRQNYDRKLLRIRKQQRMRIRREFNNLAETVNEYIAARWNQFPLAFASAAAITFLLIV